MTDLANIAGVLDGPADGEPQRPALIFDEVPRSSFGDLREATMWWAATLAGRGVGPGMRVALADWGGVRATAATLAAAHLGAATAQMNPLLTSGELAQLVTSSGCSSVAVAGGEASAALSEALGGDALVLQQPEASPGETPARAPGGGAEALVLFTSGTTGLPKAVPISHRAVAARIRAYRGPFETGRRPSVTIMCVPSFHVGGILGLLLNLYGGDTTVIQPRFDAGRWLALVERHRVSSAFLVPTMLARILDHPDLGTTDVSSIKMISYGAAAAPTELIARAMEQWPDAGFANVFGQTETLGAYTTLSPADHRDPRRLGSVGRPLPGVEIRIVDPTTGTDAATRDVGEIWVRSTQNVRAPDDGGDGDAGAAKGWLQTGDLARRDADGFVYPVGRRSDVVNRGGEKFPPSEVADVLRAHPAVADVAVTGLPDAEMGERVGAAIVLRPGARRPTADGLRSWCRGRLAPFKLPEVVVFVDALPANELGKLPRSVLVELISSKTTAEAGRAESP